MKFKFRVLDPNSMKPFRPTWWSSAKVEWAPVLLDENKPFWSAQTDTNNRPWQALDPDTLKEKEISDFILRETGQMFNTAIVRPWGNRFIVETTPWGIIHQFGTEKIPARPWMGVPDSSLIKLTEIAWKHILK